MDTTTQKRIGQALRRMYDGAANDALPDRLATLLRRLEQSLDGVDVPGGGSAARAADHRPRGPGLHGQRLDGVPLR